MMGLKQTFEDSFETYAACTIMDRAICDVRDMLKPSARMSLYAQYLEKITPDKPYKKAQKSIAAAMDHFYVHGDLSLYPMLARMGKPFAMRYILEDFQGNTGTIQESSDEAASRYTEMRLAPLSMEMIDTIDKEAIEKWFDNYSGEEQYPSVFPSKGYYNICNGSSGIAVGISSSIPQFNLTEVNEVLIKLLNNPDIDAAELICMPDFAGGGILLNASEVRKSLLNGTGAACKLRSRITYDKKNNRLVITEIPYSVYTETIRGQLNEIYNSDDNPGIDRFLDLSGATANIEIDLKKNTDVDAMIAYLCKNTSIQYHYPISLLMLDGGKTPKVFTWKEALQAHLDHEKIVYRRGFEYDLAQLEHRKHILEGYLIVLADIEEVVKLIKSAESAAIAKQLLIKNYLLDDEQASAVLKLTLSRLAHLEVEKIKKELEEIITEMNKINEILNDVVLFNKQIENGLRAVIKKYGDKRRTEILDIEGEADDINNAKTYQVILTNKNNVYIREYSNLISDSKPLTVKMPKGEYFTTATTLSGNQRLFMLNDKGEYATTSIKTLPINKLTSLKTEGNIVAMCAATTYHSHIVIVSAHGIIKKSALSDYKFNTCRWMKAIALDAGDIPAGVIFCNTNDTIGVLGENGTFLATSLADITTTGRATKGVKIGKFDTESIIAAHVVSSPNIVVVGRKFNGKLFENVAEAGNRLGRGKKLVIPDPIDFIDASFTTTNIISTNTIYPIETSVAITTNRTILTPATPTETVKVLNP